MGKKNFIRYSCDVKDCFEYLDFQPTSVEGKPILWNHITVGQIRGHSNIVMWLCPTHFKVIDSFRYGE